MSRSRGHSVAPDLFPTGRPLTVPWLHPPPQELWPAPVALQLQRGHVSSDGSGCSLLRNNALLLYGTRLYIKTIISNISGLIVKL